MITCTGDGYNDTIYVFTSDKPPQTDPRLAEIDLFIADCQARGKAARLRASQLVSGRDVA